MSNNEPQISEMDVHTASKAMSEGAFLLDVRNTSEYTDCHALGAVSIPLNALSQRVHELPKDKTICVICQSGHRSSMAVMMLKSMGITQVCNVRGGTSAWRAAGLPVETETKTTESSGGFFSRLFRG